MEAHPSLCHPERTRISYFTALTRDHLLFAPVESRVYIVFRRGHSTTYIDINIKQDGKSSQVLIAETP
jgi:hypothetical protein